MSENEVVETLKELITRCKECKFATCENCEINWNEVQAIETIINEYNNLKQIEEAHRIENGKLRKRINKIEKYVRGNEWSEDYKNSSCRTSILRILEED